MTELIQITTESIAIKGCSYIYAPAGQAGEYAPLAANPYRGCGHGCKYCYVPLVTKMKRNEFDAGAKGREDYLDHLAKDAKKYQAAGITEQVLFSFTTDVYSPFDRSLTRPSLQIVQEHGMGICVLTKGGSRALDDIDLYRPDRDCFASTLTSLDDAFSLKWEPTAALPGDRTATLRAFHERGIFTWVSLEPTLDVDSSLAIVEATHEFVDLYKIGRANYCGELTKTTNWMDYTHRMIALCEKLGVAHYIKRDLQPFLPVGYNNPLRVAQHHPAGTATVTLEKVSQKPAVAGVTLATCVATSQDSRGDFGEIISAKDAIAEFEKLDKEITERTSSWIDAFEEEVLPLLDRMNMFLSQRSEMHTLGLPSWTRWFEDYQKRTRLDLSLRTVQRKLKELRELEADFVLEPSDDGDDESGPEDEQEEAEDITPDVVENPRELLTKHVKLVKSTLADPTTKSDEERIARALELTENLELAIADGLLSGSTVAATGAVNPILTKLPVPEPSSSDDPHEVLLRNAFIAAVQSSNAVVDSEITARYTPRVHFYTGKHSIKLRAYLQEHPDCFEYRFHRGKHYFWLGEKDAPTFKTKDEAYAYEKGFRSALPEGVMWGEPPSHGG